MTAGNLLLITGAVSRPRRRRSDWRTAWRLYGAILPLALAAGMLFGTALAMWWRMWP